MICQRTGVWRISQMYSRPGCCVYKSYGSSAFSQKGADGGDSAKSICNQMSLYWQVEWWIDYPTYSHYFGIKKRHSHEILCDVSVQYECMYILFIDRFRWLRVYVPSFINLRPDLGNIFLYKFFTKILKIIWKIYTFG